MKFTRFLLGICCAAAALSACSKAEKVTKEAETHPMTITLSTDDLLTKTDLVHSGSTWKHQWKSGDAISVLSYVTYGTEGYNDKFELIDGAGTSTGKFYCATSHIPTTGSVAALALYPYSNNEDTFGNVEWDFDNQGTGSFANLGNYLFIYSEMCFEDGVFSYWIEKPGNYWAILRLPAGLKLVGNATGSNTVNIELADDGTVIEKYLRYNKKNLGAANAKGPVSLTGVSLLNGELVSDTYIVLSIVSSISEMTFTVKDGAQSVTYTLKRADPKVITYGNLYNLSQTQFTPVQNW